MQRTHMFFDGIGDVFGALGFEAIAREVDRRQRPNGGNTISRKVGSGLYSHLLALGEKGSYNVGFVAVKLVTEVSLGHGGGHSDCLSVAKGDSRQRPADAPARAPF